MAYLLSQNDRRLIAELLERERRRPSTQPTTRQSNNDDGFFTPDVYIARTPSLGIDGLTDTADSTADLPGLAECDIYRIAEDTTELEALGNEITKRVYNLSTTPITGNQWILVVRDKFGSWIAVAFAASGGGGGGNEVALWHNSTIMRVDSSDTGTGTLDEDNPSVVVDYNDRISTVIRIAAGTYSNLFDVSFGHPKAFTWSAGSRKTAEGFYEVARTASSLTIKTASGTDPEGFGIDVHGRVVNSEPDPTDPYNPVDPTTPLISTNCCVEDIPNELCLTITDVRTDNPTAGAYYEHYRGIQIPLPVVYYDEPLGRATWAGMTDVSGVGGLNEYGLVVCNTDNPSAITVTLGSPQMGIYTTDEPTQCGEDFLIEGTMIGSYLGSVEFDFILSTGPCVASAPTVSLDDSDICQDDVTLTVHGTGFDTDDITNNLLTLNLGASGHVVSATSTTLNIEFDTLPTSLGALTLIVTNDNGSSSPAVQVGLVVDCATIPPDTASWNDTFTDVDDTAITDHTPDVGTTYANLFGTAKISSNRFVAATASNGFGGTRGGVIVTFDQGTVNNTVDFDFALVDGSSFVYCLIRWDGSNGFLIQVNDTVVAIYKITTNTPSLVVSSAVGASPSHLTVTDSGTNISAEVDGVFANALGDSTGNTVTGLGIGVCDNGGMSPGATYIDNLTVIPPDTASWNDTFTGVDNTQITDHVPDSPMGGVYTELTGGMKINTGKLVVQATNTVFDGTISNGAVSILDDPGTVNNTIEFDFVLDNTGSSYVGAMLRYDGSDNGFIVVVNTTELVIYKIAAGVLTVANLGGMPIANSPTLSADTPYHLRVEDSGTQIIAIMPDGTMALVVATDATGNTQTKCGVAIGNGVYPMEATSIDNLTVSGT